MIELEGSDGKEALALASTDEVAGLIMNDLAYYKAET